jgi:hypothetical protein
MNDAEALQASGEASDASFRAQSPEEPVVSCTQPTWVEIQLLDSEGKPVPNARYRLELPDGSVLEGQLDENGLAGVDGIDPGNCDLTFPDFGQSTAELQK